VFGGLQKPSSSRSLFERYGPGYAVVGVQLENWKLMEIAVPLPEIALRHDGLTLALFLRAHAEV
jgi:hypothetical protein